MPSNRHRYLKAFVMADKDNSGTLDRSELVEALASQGIRASEADKLMDQLDLNGDGIITRGEYEIALGISSQPMEAWKSLFDELDKDHSGTVDVPELEDFLRSASMESLIPILDDWVNEFDVDRNGKLDYKEFLGFIASLEE
nr:calmodulin [Hymenolepis microstoma]